MCMTENEMKLAAAARREGEIARRYDSAKLELHRARMDWLSARAETNALREDGS